MAPARFIFLGLQRGGWDGKMHLVFPCGSARVTCPQPSPAEGTPPGDTIPSHRPPKREMLQPQSSGAQPEPTLCRGEMAAAGQRAGNPRPPAAALSSAFPPLFSPVPLPGEGSLQIKLFTDSDGKLCATHLLSPGQQPSPAARAPRRAVTRSPGYTSVPGTGREGSAAEGTRPPPPSNTGLHAQSRRARFP